MEITREEAIKILADKVKPCLSGTDWNDAIDMAIKALEKEPVLDKIRAEIIEDCGYSKDYVGAFTYSTIKLKTVLQIIDKYKAGTEAEDGNG